MAGKSTKRNAFEIQRLLIIDILLFMKRETIPTGVENERNSGNGTIITLLKNEVKDVLIEHISLKGDTVFVESEDAAILDVLLILNGEGTLIIKDIRHAINSSSIARIQYNTGYKIEVKKGKEFNFIRLRKLLDKKDIEVVRNRKNDFGTLYFKTLAECPTYREDIKSEKTLNRMILPEGLVPRFAMGSVETEGPDEVGEHEHPMLDQVFFGLEGCRCSCFANGEEALLTENMMLHIPLASKHYVSVEKGDKLAYIWMDFFLTLEGEKYMGEQHQMEDE